MFGEYAAAAAVAVGFAFIRPAGLEGKGGGADDELPTAVDADPCGAAVIVAGAATVVGGGGDGDVDGVNVKGAAEVAVAAVFRVASISNGTSSAAKKSSTLTKRNDCRASTHAFHFSSPRALAAMTEP